MKDKITEKALKLAALAENSSNEFEAHNALLLLQRLMDKYDISKIDIDAAGDKFAVIECEVQVTKGSLAASNNKYILALASTIAKNFRCKFFYSHNTVTFIGLASDVSLCEAAFKAAFGAVTNLAKAAVAEYRAQLKANYPGYKIEPHVNKYRKSYRLGFARGLEDAYRAQVESSTGTDIILLSIHPKVTEYMDKTHNNLVTTRGRGQSVGAGFYEGIAAGRAYGSAESQPNLLD